VNNNDGYLVEGMQQVSGVRCQMTENRRQMTENRRQMAENRGKRFEDCDFELV
jgi:hypothetical protein